MCFWGFQKKKRKVNFFFKRKVLGGKKEEQVVGFWIRKKEEIGGEGKEGRVGSLLQLLVLVEEKGFLVNTGF